MDPKIENYAPELWFHRSERHHPGSPEDFRKNARFRQSNFSGGKDRGWNHRDAVWVPGNEKGPNFVGEQWDRINKVILDETKQLRSEGPTVGGPVSRPRDDRNLWKGDDGKRGFFLELIEGHGRDSSGAPAGTRLPIFYDLYDHRIAAYEYEVLTFWFFYVYNWHVFFAHEGDWEHISLYFDRGRRDGIRKPYAIYYAAHNGGEVYFDNEQRSPVHWVDGTHPRVYVNHWGHPCHPRVARHLQRQYKDSWRTWEASPTGDHLLDIGKAEWRDYCGAWGEVGQWVHSTGPLGPNFKRFRDKVDLRR